VDLSQAAARARLLQARLLKSTTDHQSQTDFTVTLHLGNSGDS